MNCVVWQFEQEDEMGQSAGRSTFMVELSEELGIGGFLRRLLVSF